MFALQPPPLSPVDVMPMALGQTLIELVCHPPQAEALPLRVIEQLGTGLKVDFCVLAIGRRVKEGRQVWYWSAEEGGRSLASGPFWHHSWIKAIAAHPNPVPAPRGFNEDNAADLFGPWRGGLGLRTLFQGQVNGLVLLGEGSQHPVSHRQGQELITLQASLGVVNHLLRTQPLTPADSTPTPAAKLTLEDSPIVRLWYDATRQQLEQQRQWNEQLIHNIVTTMSDQTRNPLATLRMGIELLRKAPPTAEQLPQRLAILEGEWRKLNEINEKILQLRNLKAEEDTVLLTRFDLLPVLQTVIDQSADPPRIVIHHWPDRPCRVDANYGHLQQILRELLTNAHKFSPPTTPITLGVTTEREGDQSFIRLACTNISHHLSPQNLKYWFDPFYREQPVVDAAIAGIGLGLTITRTLIEQLNGKIDVTYNPLLAGEGGEVTFTLKIPGQLAGI